MGVGWFSRVGGLGVELLVGDFVAFGIEAGVALGEDDDAFDEAPDGVADKGDVGDDREGAKDDIEEGGVAREGAEGDGDDGKEDAADGEADVDSSPFDVAEIPVVCADAAEKNAE